MGFTVSEYIFWDAEQLCLDPSVLLNVVEVEVPTQKLLPRPDLQLSFPPLHPLVTKAFSRLGFLVLQWQSTWRTTFPNIPVP